MKWICINPTHLLLIVTLAMINHHGHYVDGAVYQSDSSTRGIDNSDSSVNSGSANYQFEYGVDDGSVGQQFGHEEERNGRVTRGRYSVLLPDGRLQVVTYRADENGYKADVTYENGPDNGSGGVSNKATGNNGASGGYGYENVETSASSYGPPAPPTPQKNYNKGNSRSNSFQTGGKSVGKGNFVKLRRTIDGKMFNYAY